MNAPANTNALLGISRPTPEFVHAPDLTRDAAASMLAEAQRDAQDVPVDRGPHRPQGNLFLPVERATDELQQAFGRPPSIYEVAAGVASRPDLMEPVDRATLRWKGPSEPTVADSWFMSESVGDRMRLEVERAAVAGALLECLQDWEYQVLRARLEARMTQREITHVLAYSQFRACLALMRGLDALDAGSTASQP
jgi:DNA-directed RNA polymerase specialized sigma subunit